VVTRDANGSDEIARFGPVAAPRLILNDEAKRRLPFREPLWWKVIARGPYGVTASQPPLARFVLDPSAPATSARDEVLPGPDAVVVRASLWGDATPEYGRLERSVGFESARGPNGDSPGAVRLNGRDQMVVYALPEELGEDYSAMVWVRVNALPRERIGQILSLWAGSMDDPLRLTVDQGRLCARIEAGQGYSTHGTPIEPGTWQHVAAVKESSRLTLYLNGTAIETIDVPGSIESQGRVCALGGNPNYSGNEFLSADFSDFQLYARALQPYEVARDAR